MNVAPGPETDLASSIAAPPLERDNGVGELLLGLCLLARVFAASPLMQ